MIDTEEIIQLCGIAHLLLGAGSLVIPQMLEWDTALQNVPPLIRQMFWTYAGYILGLNLFFGVVSILYAGELLSGSGLAMALTLLIALYWLARLFIQFFYFDKRNLPQSAIYRVGEVALVALFIIFTIVYSWAFYINYSL